MSKEQFGVRLAHFGYVFSHFSSFLSKQQHSFLGKKKTIFLDAHNGQKCLLCHILRSSDSP